MPSPFNLLSDCKEYLMTVCSVAEKNENQGFL